MFYSVKNYRPLFILERIIEACNLSPKVFIERYYSNEIKNYELYKEIISNFFLQDFLKSFLTYLYSQDKDDIEKTLKTISYFVLEKTKEITKDSSTNSYVLFLLMKKDNRKIKYINPKENKKPKVLKITKYDKNWDKDFRKDIDKVIHLYYPNFEETINLEDFKKIDFKKVDEDFVNKNFLNKGKEEYSNFLRDYAFFIIQEKNNKEYITKFFLILNFVADERFFYSFILVTDEMLKYVNDDEKKYVYKYQKQILDMYFSFKDILDNEYFIFLAKKRMELDKLNLENKIYKEQIFNKILKYFDIPRKDCGIKKAGTKRKGDTNAGLEYFPNIFLKENKNLDTLKFNLNLRTLMAGFICIEWVRFFNKKGLGRNNKNIEYIIKHLENIVNIFKQNHKKFHPAVFQRVISLIYFKNSIKIKYSINNDNKWDLVELLEEYEKDILFILENHYFLVTGGELKIFEMLTQIQIIYNALPIYNYKNLKGIYEKYIKYSRLFKVFSVTNFVDSIYKFEKNEKCSTLASVKTKIKKISYTKYWDNTIFSAQEYAFNQPSYAVSLKKNDYRKKVLKKLIMLGFYKLPFSEDNKDLTIFKINDELKFKYLW